MRVVKWVYQAQPLTSVWRFFLSCFFGWSTDSSLRPGEMKIFRIMQREMMRNLRNFVHGCAVVAGEARKIQFSHKEL